MINKCNKLYQTDLLHIISFDSFRQLHGKSLLVTGATGLIGTCLIDAIMLANEKGAEITLYAVGRSREKASERLGDYYDNKHFHFIEQDVRQPLPSLISMDYIIPLASNTHPLAYSKYPVETIEINVKGAEYALQKAADSGATVLYPSTVEVYGNANGFDVFAEDYTGHLNLSTSRSCYTEAKRVSEALCQSYAAEFGVDVRIVRLSRIFGPTMQLTDSKASSQFIKKALAGESIVLKSKGDQLFSYTYVADAVSAILYVMLNGRQAVAYNVASDNCNVKLKEFAKACAQWAKSDVVFELPTEVEKAGFSIASQAVLSTERLRSLGWSASYSFNDAITRTLNILK